MPFLTLSQCIYGHLGHFWPKRLTSDKYDSLAKQGEDKSGGSLSPRYSSTVENLQGAASSEGSLGSFDLSWMQ